MSDFIFSARFLPTLAKKSLNEFAITSGLVVGPVSIINSENYYYYYYYYILFKVQYPMYINVYDTSSLD